MSRSECLVAPFPCMTEKEIYRDLCEKENSIPLFSQAWWMDATCGESAWNVILVRNSQGEVVASLPYLLKKKWGFKFICQPQLTQTNGVWFRPTPYKNDNERLSAEKKMDDAIIQRIDSMKLLFFSQCFHHSFSNWLPFHWRGFWQTTRYTYRTSDIQDLDTVLLRFSDAKQRHIKKAMRNGLRADTMDAEAFYEFCCSAHEKRGEKNILSKELVLRCISAALSRGNGKIIAIKDKEEKIHSALFLCWDKESAYYLIPATLPEYKTSGASSLLVWEAFQEAQRQNLQSFDFEGSMEENIENSYRQYGAEQTPYFKISKGLLSHFL